MSPQRRSLRSVVPVLFVVALVLPAIPAAAAGSGPIFYVDPVLDGVRGDGWAPDADVTVTLGTSKPATVTTRTSGLGSFATGPLAYDIKPGEVIAVSDGTTTSPDYTVTTLGVSTIDPASDTVAGVAPKGTSVTAGVIGGPETTVSVTKTGVWSAHFEEFDLRPGMAGSAVQYQSEPGATDPFAATWIEWRSATPVFRVDPQGDAIHGPAVGDRLGAAFAWPPRATLSVTIAGDGPDTTVTVVTAKKDGSFSLEGVRDVVAGDVVTVTDGTTTKTHTVSGLTLGDIDVVTDQVHGTAEPGSQVYVQPSLLLGSASRLVTAGSDGAWTADFSVASGEPPFDIRYMQMGYAAQQDEDGDATHIGWHTWIPNFRVDPESDVVSGVWWGHADPTLDPTVVPEVVRVSIGASEWFPVADGPESSFTLDLGGAYDIQVGDTVTLEWETLVKTHTVVPLTMSVDMDTDVVSGTGDRGATIDVSVYDDSGGGGRHVVVDKKGAWLADFAKVEDIPVDPEGPFDITPFTDVSARWVDDDGDGTIVRRPPLVSASFTVDPDRDSVWGFDWTPSSEVTITVNGQATFAAQTDETGSFWRGIDPETEIDVLRGDTVSVTDGVTVKEVTVSSLAVTVIDLDTDVVSGVATADRQVHVGVWTEDGESLVELEVEADGGGDWIASFAGVGYDLVAETQGYAFEMEPDGDCTQIDWWVEP